MSNEQMSLPVYELITPQVAKNYLKHNTSNRSLRDKHVRVLAGAMERGEWLPNNGSSIKFSTDGALLDGQHRLSAVIMADKPTMMMVLRNLPMAAMKTIDRNQVRSIGDVLRIFEGEKYDNNYTLANVTGSVALGLMCRANNSDGNPMTFGSRYTTDEVIKYIDSHPIIIECARRAAKGWLHQYMSSKLAGVCLYLFLEDDERKAIVFFDKLVSGANLSIGDPILILRNKLIELYSNKRYERITQSMKAAIVFKTWRRYKQGGKWRTLFIKKNEKNIYRLND